MCVCYVYNTAKDHHLWSVNNARHCSFVVSKNSLEKAILSLRLLACKTCAQWDTFICEPMYFRVLPENFFTGHWLLASSGTAALLLLLNVLWNARSTRHAEFIYQYGYTLLTWWNMRPYDAVCCVATWHRPMIFRSRQTARYKKTCVYA